MKLLLLFLLFYPFSLFGASLHLSQKQLKTLNTVAKIAKTIPDVHGKTYEDTMCAICLTESSAAHNTLKNTYTKNSLAKGSFGIMQIQVPTTRYVAKQIKTLHWVLSLSDMEIAKRLVKDTRFSARIATHYFVLLQNKRKNYVQAVGGYNGGIQNHSYYKRVMQNFQKIANSRHKCNTYTF